MSEHSSDADGTLIESNQNDSGNQMDVDNPINEPDNMTCSQSTHASDLLDELPPAPEVEKNIAALVTRFLDLFDYYCLDLDVFVHAIFYNEKYPSLRNDSRVKTARTNYMASPLFKKILQNQLGPPRTNAKGKACERGKVVLEEFAFETVEAILMEELRQFGKSVRKESFETEVPEETTNTNSLLNCMLGKAIEESPSLFGLLTAISEPTSGEKGKSDRVCFSS